MMLGNMSVEQIEQRCGIEFTKAEKDLLNSTRQTKAENIEKGKWHCFDIPFTILCGDKEFAEVIYKLFTKYAKKIKCQIGVAWC